VLELNTTQQINAQATSVGTHIRNNQLASTDLKVTVCTAGTRVANLRSEASNKHVYAT